MAPSGKKLTLFCDGASRGNPGPSSYGFVVLEHGKAVATEGGIIGNTTNNVAEYQGLLHGLEKCRELGAGEVVVKSDSQVLVRQLNGEYKVKAPHLKVLVEKALVLLQGFKKTTILHIPREENSDADRAANDALDG